MAKELTAVINTLTAAISTAGSCSVCWVHEAVQGWKDQEGEGTAYTHHLPPALENQPANQPTNQTTWANSAVESSGEIQMKGMADAAWS